MNVSNSVGGWIPATNVLAGTDFVSVGATPATAAYFRVPSASADVMDARNSANSANLTLLAMDGSNNCYIGTDSSFTRSVSNLRIYSAGTTFFGGAAGANIASFSTTTFSSFMPISWTGGATATLSQVDTVSATGIAMKLQAQNAATTGGKVTITSGTGGTIAGLIELQTGGTTRVNITATPNIAFFGAGSFGGGVGVLSQIDATTTPTSNPSGGGILYSDTGAGKWRGSGGTTTTFGPADPHCPQCGSDHGFEWENELFDEYTFACARCMIESLRGLGVDVDKFSFTQRRGSPNAGASPLHPTPRSLPSLRSGVAHRAGPPSDHRSPQGTPSDPENDS